MAYKTLKVACFIIFIVLILLCKMTVVPAWIRVLLILMTSSVTVTALTLTYTFYTSRPVAQTSVMNYMAQVTIFKSGAPLYIACLVIVSLCYVILILKLYNLI